MSKYDQVSFEHRKVEFRTDASERNDYEVVSEEIKKLLRDGFETMQIVKREKWITLKAFKDNYHLGSESAKKYVRRSNKA